MPRTRPTLTDLVRTEIDRAKADGKLSHQQQNNVAAIFLGHDVMVARSDARRTVSACQYAVTGGVVECHRTVVSGPGYRTELFRVQRDGTITQH